MTERDKKYIDKKRFHAEGSEELIFNVLKLFYQAISQKENKSIQIATVEKMCLKISVNTEVKEKEQKFLADTIYKYAIGTGYFRVEKGRVTLTQKAKKVLKFEFGLE